MGRNGRMRENNEQDYICKKMREKDEKDLKNEREG